MIAHDHIGRNHGLRDIPQLIAHDHIGRADGLRRPLCIAGLPITRPREAP